MDILLRLQEPGSAELMVALALLPWVGIALIQAISMLTSDKLDDNFGARAIAALRWAEETPDPATPAKSAVLEYRVRAPARIRVGDHAAIKDAAA